MFRPLVLVAALAFATGTAAVAQSAAPVKIKVKTKSGRGEAAAAAPTPTAPAANAPDWSVQYAATITPDDLRRHLTVLASDEYEGREMGKKGQKMAADYLAKAFAAAGVAGPVAGSDNAYLQHFDMNRTSLDVPASTVQVGGKTYQGGRDFYGLLDETFGAPTSVQPVFVGYGIKEEKYSDFAGASDLKGKDIVLLAGEPRNAQGQSLLSTDGKPSPYAGLDLKGVGARQRAIFPLGARSVTVVMPDAASFAQVPASFDRLLSNDGDLTFAGAPKKPSSRSNLLIVSAELGAKLLGTTPAGLDRYRQAVGKTGKPVASPFKPAAATVHGVLKAEPFTTENVLGYLEGTNKKDEVLVVSAHYDHLGVKNGQIYHGADDDGSGTASVLELAEAFGQAKKDGHGPRRSVLFLANTGEEAGLIGSQYYTDHPVFKLENTVADLHIDMIGRIDKAHAGQSGDYVAVVGDDKLSTELRAVNEAANRKYTRLALDYRYNDPNDPQRVYYRSDHYNFAKHNVPIIFYTTGEHDDYHKPTDTVDKIDFAAMTHRGQLVFHTAWELANRDARPALRPEFLAPAFVPAAADLDRYVGTYASAQIPLKLTISKDGTALKAQATGQPALTLEAVSKDVFKFDLAGIRVEFDPATPTLLLKQGGGAFTFTKE